MCRCVCVCARAVRTPVRRTLRSSSAPSTRRVYRALEKESGGRGGEGRDADRLMEGEGRQTDGEGTTRVQGGGESTHPSCVRVRPRICARACFCASHACALRVARVRTCGCWSGHGPFPSSPPPPAASPGEFAGLCVCFCARAMVRSCLRARTCLRASARALGRLRAHVIRGTRGDVAGSGDRCWARIGSCHGDPPHARCSHVLARYSAHGYMYCGLRGPP